MKLAPAYRRNKQGIYDTTNGFYVVDFTRQSVDLHLHPSRPRNSWDTVTHIMWKIGRITDSDIAEQLWRLGWPSPFENLSRRTLAREKLKAYAENFHETAHYRCET